MTSEAVSGEAEKRRAYSDNVLESFRAELGGAQLPEGYAVVINGSFARREASEQSDVDYFVLHEAADSSVRDIEIIREAVDAAIERCNLKPPSAGGAFAKPETIDEFLKNVGGTNDPNEKLTRRMLFMLEGDWLTQKELFLSYRNRLIANVYAKESQSNHSLARFFLNDVIRYWRTIGVDFEHKTTEGGKAWGTRNLKLVFSRKLLYFSGLLMAAETAQQTPTSKARILNELCALDPLARVGKIVGSDARRALNLYDNFLVCLSNKDFRDMADRVQLEDKDRPEDFNDLKNLGQHFSWELDRLLHVTYGPRHPIHHALVF